MTALPPIPSRKPDGYYLRGDAAKNLGRVFRCWMHRWVIIDQRRAINNRWKTSLANVWRYTAQCRVCLHKMTFTYRGERAAVPGRRREKIEGHYSWRKTAKAQRRRKAKHRIHRQKPGLPGWTERHSAPLRSSRTSRGFLTARSPSASFRTG